MISITKKDNFFAPSYIIADDNDSFMIYMGDNLDLYWTYYPEDMDIDKKTFIINKDDEFIYDLISNLYQDIKNNDPYNSGVTVSTFTNSPYENGKVVWHSDDGNIDTGSSLEIEEDKGLYKITFNRAKVFDDVFCAYSIRFRNNGSRYDPYNFTFMKAYNGLDNNYEKIYVKK